MIWVFHLPPMIFMVKKLLRFSDLIFPKAQTFSKMTKQREKRFLIT